MATCCCCRDKEEAMKQFEITPGRILPILGYEQMLRIVLPDTLALDKVVEITLAGIENMPTAPRFTLLGIGQVPAEEIQGGIGRI